MCYRMVGAQEREPTPSSPLGRNPGGSSMFDLRRREFITLLGGAAASWPLAARAQQAERMQRFGVLMNVAADDAEGQGRVAAFQQALQRHGWADGRDMRID